MVFFEHVTYGNAIAKLGSLMDVAPMLRKMQEHFPGRVVLFRQSAEADRLWRHWLRYMVEKEGAIDLRDPHLYREREAFARSHRMGAAHVADLFTVVEEGYSSLQFLGVDSRVVGQQSSNGYLNDPGSEGPDISVERDPYFNHVINLPALPKPAFMRAALKMVEYLVRVDREDPSFSLGDSQICPVLWTTNQEVEAAARFFVEKRLASEKTIGLHLTANTFNSFNGMLARKEFMDLARYLIQHGLTVLLITGTLDGVKPPEERGDKWQVHQQFYEELRTETPDQVEIFYGDVLVQGEIMRRCKFFVSPETGPAHVASAVGVPKLTIAADGFQVDNFLLTGPEDFRFIAPRSSLGRPLKLLDMVEALETLIHRPYVPNPLFARQLDEKSLVVSSGKEIEVLSF
ncbi:MAG: hypothetical protein NT099_05750 [Candidatus Saganbacteria bacterium]|nr:hypothetical protein [Candidatus Saganbacteria bacterium]